MLHAATIALQMFALCVEDLEAFSNWLKPRTLNSVDIFIQLILHLINYCINYDEIG